jgi:putative ABC transport system permease protein
MRRPRWRKALSDLWINPTRSLLVIASITVGLFALGTIATIRIIVHQDMQAGYSAANPANIQIQTSLFDPKLVEHIRKMPGVLQAEGARNFSLRIQTMPGEWLTINLRSVHDWNKSAINHLEAISGNWPPIEHEVFIEKYRLPDTNALPGDMLTFELPNGGVRGITRQLKLSGVVIEQTLGAFQTGPGFFLAPVQGYVNENSLEWLGQTKPDYFNTLYLTVDKNTEDKSYLRLIAQQVSSEMEKNGVTIINTAVRGKFDHPNRVFVEALGVILVFLGFLVVFLSGFLITNTLQALVTQQVQQIGIMKSLGARQPQIISIYVVLILIFSIISIAIAVPLSNEVAFRIVELLTDRINIIYQGKRFVPIALILQASIGLLVPQLAALQPIWQGARLTIQEALSGIDQNRSLKPGRLSLTISRFRRITRPTIIALRNTVRKKGRLLLTLITLSLGGAVFIATFNVQYSMSEYVLQVSRYFLGDVNVTLNTPYRIQEIEPVILEVPGIDYIEAWGGARSELLEGTGKKVGESVQMLAPPVESRLVQPIILQGRWFEPGDSNAIVLNESFMARFPDLKIGDELKMRVNGKETDWIVVGFFKLVGRSGGLIAYTSFEYLAKIINQPDQAYIFRVAALQKDMTQDQQKELGRQIEAKLSKMGFEIYEITAGKWLSSASAKGFSVLTAFLLFLAVLTAFVGSIGLAGTMSMNVMERTREIGILRAIGASNRILMRMILLEGSLIGAASWILASLLALPISKLMSDSVSQALFGSPSVMLITPTGFLIWLGVVIILSLLASALPARTAARLTIREVLAYE